jgi:hypothetical protein
LGLAVSSSQISFAGTLPLIAKLRIGFFLMEPLSRHCRAMGPVRRECDRPAPLQITKVTGASNVQLIVMTSRPISKIDNIAGARIVYPHGTYYLSDLDLENIDREMKQLLFLKPDSAPLIGVWQLHNPNGKDYQSDLFGHLAARSTAYGTRYRIPAPARYSPREH